MDTNRKATIAFSLCGGIGPVTYKKLCSKLGSAHEAFKASENILKGLLSQSQLIRFLSFRRKSSFEHELEHFERKGIWILTCLDTDYPKRLHELIDPPLCLYGRGNKQYLQIQNALYVSLVGTRRPTKYGQQIALSIAQSLAQSGVIIVSGMATGIDTLAHQGAIQGGGKTILVLGTAIDKVYPSHNQELYNSVVQKNGCIISEYHPGMIVNKGMFVSRNRIIASLCDSTIIVEGGVKSGSLITARIALEIGREVYAVPGPINSEMSVGPNLLINEGAHVFIGVEDFLRDHAMQFNNKKTSSLIKQNNAITELTDIERQIIQLLSQQELHVDELIASLHLKESDILTYLSLLEIRGLVKKQIDGTFIIL